MYLNAYILHLKQIKVNVKISQNNHKIFKGRKYNEKVALHNLGCKVNTYETDAMAQSLRENGYEIMPFEEGADVYIINTCSVTNIADRKSRQMLHRAKSLTLRL